MDSSSSAVPMSNVPCFADNLFLTAYLTKTSHGDFILRNFNESRAQFRRQPRPSEASSPTRRRGGSTSGRTESDGGDEVAPGGRPVSPVPAVAVWQLPGKPLITAASSDSRGSP